MLYHAVHKHTAFTIVNSVLHYINKSIILIISHENHEVPYFILY